MKLLKITLLAIGLLILSGCASQPFPDAYDPPGFFMGLWNGFTIWFSMIGHIFNSDIRICAFPNSGGWYDFGFVLGVSSWGGVAAAR